MGDVPQAHPNNAQVGTEQAVCLQLRLEGQSFRAIAATTGLSVGTVYTRIRDAIDLEVNPKAEELRAIECERLDSYLARLAPKIADGDDRAINTAVRIGERRSKLLGLDMPTRVDATLETHEVTERDIELRQLIAEAKANNALEVAQLRDQHGGGVQ